MSIHSGDSRAGTITEHSFRVGARSAPRDRALRKRVQPPPKGGGSIPIVKREAGPLSGAPTAPPQTDEDAGEETTSWGEAIIGALLACLILLPILLILSGLLLGIPISILAVSLVMDGGCLRYLLFAVGWIVSVVSGMFTGLIAVLSLEILGLGSETIGEAVIDNVFGAGPFVFFWGYPIVAVWGRRRLQSMPRDQFLAWKQSLTGGALLGFGAGSAASLLRSAFAFKSGGGSFGGGSFGGGGASGSFQGAAVTATGAAAPTTTGVRAAEKPAGPAGEAPSTPNNGDGIASPSTTRRAAENLFARMKRWLQRFQWYHGLAFALVTLTFVPLGLGTVEALQNTEVFVSILVVGLGYGIYRLWRRRRRTDSPTVLSDSIFRGGEASTTWS